MIHIVRAIQSAYSKKVWQICCWIFLPTPAHAAASFLSLCILSSAAMPKRSTDGALWPICSEILMILFWYFWLTSMLWMVPCFKTYFDIFGWLVSPCSAHFVGWSEMKVDAEVELTNNPNQFLLSILYQSVTVGISGTVSERGLPDLLLHYRIGLSWKS